MVELYTCYRCQFTLTEKFSSRLSRVRKRIHFIDILESTQPRKHKPVNEFVLQFKRKVGWYITLLSISDQFSLVPGSWLVPAFWRSGLIIGYFIPVDNMTDQEWGLTFSMPFSKSR